MITKIGIYRDPRKTKPWVVRWFGDYDPATGKQKRYSKSFHRKRDAEAFQSELTMAFKEGQQRDNPDEITLEDFCSEWLKTKSAELKAESLKLYTYTIERLLSYFGPDILLSKVRPMSAARFIAELKPLKGEDLSEWTRHKTLRHCKTMFRCAVTWELIPKNPFKDVKAPRCVIRPWHYLTPEEYKRLFAASPSLLCRAAYAVAYTAGLRFGELFSLTWNDIDFETGEVRIQNRPATATMPPFYVKDYEARRIPIPKHTLDILTQLQTKAPEGIPYVLLSERQYKTVMAKWKRCQQEKRPWLNRDTVNNVPREFKRHLKRAGITPNGTLSIHTLRKSCIQNWANELPINVTKELAGHSSIVTTQKYYLQVDEYHRAKAAAVIESLISGGKEFDKTDARVTPEGSFYQKSSRGQS